MTFWEEGVDMWKLPLDGESGRVLEGILKEALRKVRGDVVVKDNLAVVDDYIVIKGRKVRIEGDIYILAIGKASVAMAKGAEDVLGDRIKGGLVVTKYGFSMPLKMCRVIEAGHPIPDENGLKAARLAFDLVRGLSEGDILLVLISGGGSALLPAPDGITLRDKMFVTDLLLKSGATIQEINCVRKHLSFLKGGKLRKAAYPAKVVTMVLSDVIGNDLSSIASGPTFADSTTFEDAVNVLRRYGLWDRVPLSVRRHLQEGVEGRAQETLKPEDEDMNRSITEIIGDNRYFCNVLCEAARKANISPVHFTSFVEGEAREVAKVIAAVVKEYLFRRENTPKLLIFGGETTVRIKGNGKGGRSQELALSLAVSMSGWKGYRVVSISTDGNDGPTDAAGAVVDDTTLVRAHEKGLNPLSYLDDNDSYHFFDELKNLVFTGPTQTNVNDVVVALVGYD